MPAKVEFGFIAPVAREAFASLKVVSPMTWLKRWIPEFRDRSDLTQEQVRDESFTARRSLYIDIYVAAWIFFELIFFVSQMSGAPACIRYIIVIFSAVRIVEIFRVNIGIAVFDQNTRPDLIVSHRERLIVNVVINYVELMILFGGIYEAFLSFLGSGGHIRMGSGYYFSFITQLTIGYGDIYPLSGLRLVAALQGFIGSIFAVLLFARALSLYSPLVNFLERGHASKVTPPQSDNVCWTAKEERD